MNLINNTMATKKITHEFIELLVKAKCSKTGKEFTVSVGQWDIYSHEQECEICGSHGEMTVDIHCPECGQTHSHVLKSW